MSFTLLKKHKVLVKEFIKYFIVGGIAFFVDFSTLFIFTNFFNVYYLVSAFYGFCFGLIVNYYLSIIWVFENRSLKNKTHEFLIFLAIGFVSLGINEYSMYFFTEVLLIYYLFSKIISTILVYLFNFVSRKLLLFK